MSYPYKLPDLPYDYNALEPYIDDRTMHFHHDKHQRGYVNKLNDALASWPEGQQRDLVHMLSDPESIPQHVRTAIINNGGGAWIHTLFFNIMKPAGGQGPTGELAQAIISSFGSIESFKKQFFTDATAFFGSGWVWLVIGTDGMLKIVSTPGHDLPQAQGLMPILVIDVWEHAYYLKFQNRRHEYIQNWWHVINWPLVADLYNQKLITI